MSISIFTHIDELIPFLSEFIDNELKNILNNHFNLCESSTCYFPVYIVIHQSENLVGIIMFNRVISKRKIVLKKKKLFSFNLHTLVFIDKYFTESIEPEILSEALNKLFNKIYVDIFLCNDLPIDQFSINLLQSLRLLKLSYVITSNINSKHWYIRLPENINQYYNSLSPKTRQSIKRKNRKINNISSKFILVSKKEDIPMFLEEGEKISRETYQWKIGQKLHNDLPTKKRFQYLAETNSLRCYLLYINNNPCAFLRGYQINNTYYFETPGFLPQYRSHSPGVVLLMYALNDLIENTDVKIFDFGQGGDDSGYKKTLGNSHVLTEDVVILTRLRFKSLIYFIILKSIKILKSFIRSK